MMDNSYYLLSNQKVTVEKFHICTWDMIGGNACIELGIEITNNADWVCPLDVFLVLPFLNTECKITSLHDQLSKFENCRFIFNDIVDSLNPIEGDYRNGCLAKFEVRDALAILPFKKENKETKKKNEKIIHLVINAPEECRDALYTRILIQTNYHTLAIEKKGIAKNAYIYDIKVNETRNLSDDVYILKKEKKLSFCAIKSVFCLHSVPDDYEINFIDAVKLKNIRKLEIDAFQKYLPCIKSLKHDKYIIAFNKDGNKESYSFFSRFTKEAVGNKQILLAVGINIFCSLLFAIYSFRIVRDKTTEWYNQIPFEWYIVALVLVLLIIYCISKWRK